MINYLIHRTPTGWNVFWEFNTQVSLQEAWQWFVANDKLHTWFPQLSFHDDHLLFHIEEQEPINLRVTAYQPEKFIDFEWFGASIHMALLDAGNFRRITFEEELPHDFSQAMRDMTGWVVNGYIVQALMEGQPVPNRDELIPNIQQKIAEVF